MSPSPAPEPPRLRPRLTGMLRRTVMPVWATAALAATVLAAGCGTQPGSGGGPDVNTSASPESTSGGAAESPGASTRSVPSTDGASGQRIDSRLIYFSNDQRFPHSVQTVLRTERDRARFPGWFAGAGTARRIADRITATDLQTSVLVGTVVTTGCSKAGSARLLADGARITVRLLDLPEPPPECYAPYQALAVFEVPKDRMPDRPRFGARDERPDPAGPGELAAFTEVDSVDPPGGPPKAEITEPGALTRFLAPYPSGTAKRVRAQLTAREPSGGKDERLFAFRLSGCRLEGAELYVYADERGLSAVPVGGENVRCVRPEHFLAVFALRSPLVPESPLPSASRP